MLLFIYLFIYFWLCWVFVSVRGFSLVAARGGHSSSRCVGLSLSRPLLLGAQAPDAQAQQLWPTGPVAPQHVGSSQTRARTCVPCIGRQTLNHCATRKALTSSFLISMYLWIFQFSSYNWFLVSAIEVGKDAWYDFGFLKTSFFTITCDPPWRIFCVHVRKICFCCFWMDFSIYVC